MTTAQDTVLAGIDPPTCGAIPDQRVHSRQFDMRGVDVKRVAKFCTAVAVAGVGAYGLFSGEYNLTSDSAVVTAYVTSIRSPIDGEVQGLPAHAGVWVQTNKMLAHIENTRADEERLADLHERVNNAASEEKAIASERTALLTAKAHMLLRTKAHVLGVVARLESEAIAQQRNVSAGDASAVQARSDLRRGTELYKDGIISMQHLEQLTTADRVSAQQLEAAQINLKMLQMEADTARHGILTEPGVNNDVAYSQQRADEIDIRLAENAYILATDEAKVEELRKNLDKEVARTGMMHAADLTSSAKAFIWRLDASNGERVAVGDAVAEVVNCDEATLMAAIPQSRVPDVLVGGKAKIRLSGEETVLTGIVQQVTADPLEGDNKKLAVLPLKNTEQRMAAVQIRFDQPEKRGGSCLVGRTASVVMPTVASSAFGRWLRLYF